MGRTKWICTVPGCNANPSKRNNIERHVWLQHIRRCQNSETHEDYKVTEHKKQVEPFVRRYNGPAVMTPPDSPHESSVYSDGASSEGFYVRSQHEHSNCLSTTKTIRPRPYKFPSSYQSSVNHSPALSFKSTSHDGGMRPTSNESYESPIVQSSVVDNEDPLAFLARACEYKSQIEFSDEQSAVNSMEVSSTPPFLDAGEIHKAGIPTPQVTNATVFDFSKKALSSIQYSNNQTPADPIGSTPQLNPDGAFSPTFDTSAVDSPMFMGYPSKSGFNINTSMNSLSSYVRTAHSHAYNPYNRGGIMANIQRALSADALNARVGVQGDEIVWRPW